MLPERDKVIVVNVSLQILGKMCYLNCVFFCFYVTRNDNLLVE